MFRYNFRKRFVTNTSTNRNLVSYGITLVAGLFMKLWSSVVSHDTQLNTTHASAEDAMYEGYRDELDDYVTIEDNI